MWTSTTTCSSALRSSEVRFLEASDVLAIHEIALKVGVATGTATRDDLAAAFARAMGGEPILLEP